MNEGNEQLSGMHHVDFMLSYFFVLQWLLHFQDHFCSLENFFRIVNQFGASLQVVLVVKKCTFSCRLLNQNFESVADKLTHGFRCCCHAGLIVHNLFRNSNNHSQKVFS